MDPMIPLGQPRPLRYTTRAMRLVEERSGHSLGELIITRVGVASAVYLLWGGLIHSDAAFQKRQEPSLTIDDVCDLLDAHWFPHKTLKDLSPFFTQAAIQSGYFTGAVEGKAQPETGAGSPGSGVSEPSTTDSAIGSNG